MKKLLLLAAMALAFAAAPAWAQSGEPNDRSLIVPPTVDETGQAPQDGPADGDASPSGASGQPAPSPAEPAPTGQPQ